VAPVTVIPTGESKDAVLKRVLGRRLILLFPGSVVTFGARPLAHRECAGAHGLTAMAGGPFAGARTGSIQAGSSESALEYVLIEKVDRLFR